MSFLLVFIKATVDIVIVAIITKAPQKEITEELESVKAEFK